jgi:DNA repair protein RadC
MKQDIHAIRHLMPVQKCLSGGEISALSDAELISAILATGTRLRDVREVSEELLRRFQGLQGLNASGLRELSETGGIGPAKSVRIHAAFELGKRMLVQTRVPAVVDTPVKVWKMLQPEMARLLHEEFRVLILNNKNMLLKNSVVSIGTISEALVHPREIFRDAIREAAASIIVAHNHPSGVLVPSKEDISSTIRIRDAGKIIGIELLDHVIIGGASYLSLKEGGYI